MSSNKKITLKTNIKTNNSNASKTNSNNASKTNDNNTSKTNKSDAPKTNDSNGSETNESRNFLNECYEQDLEDIRNPFYNNVHWCKMYLELTKGSSNKGPFGYDD
ncbi:hypothetical protein F8M41_018103 [Gigaspora margarita]|uniref:Uncharacterized protein n=1 Tax=Gigaspora margarita TaxID=4874 RepID=A0A8H4EUK0_GIGMA|nr:hypothetical protein F8M41_018103 [Gigaspora margarita]